MGDKGMIPIAEILEGKAKPTSWAQENEEEEVAEEKVAKSVKTWNTIEKVEAVSIKDQHAAVMSNEPIIKDEPYRVRDVIHHGTRSDQPSFQNSSRYVSEGGHHYHQNYDGFRDDFESSRMQQSSRGFQDYRPRYGESSSYQQRPRGGDDAYYGNGSGRPWRGGNGGTTPHRAYASPPKHQSYTPRPHGGHREVPIPTSPPWRAFVGRLHPQARREDLLNLFQDLAVKSVSLISNSSEQTSSQPYGYVEFEDQHSLEQALKYDNTELLGSPIHVDVATRKSSNYAGRSATSLETRPAPTERKPLVLEPRTTPLSSNDPRSTSGRDSIFGSAVPTDKDYYDTQSTTHQARFTSKSKPDARVSPSTEPAHSASPSKSEFSRGGGSAKNKIKNNNSKKPPLARRENITPEGGDHPRPPKNKNVTGSVPAVINPARQSVTANNLFAILEELT